MTDLQPVGLYIHIPFCKSKCPYCDFYSMRANEQTKSDYVKALKQMLRETEGIFDTVYFGGGTPSSLGAEAIADILGCVKVTDGCEITVECNPSDTGRKDINFDFDALKSAGVNRISMGLQSAVDSERKALGRLSGRDEVSRAIDRAFKAGIDNISLDLMAGIPDQSLNTLSESINFCVSSGAKHISSYLLKIEEGTFMQKNIGRYNLPSEEAVAEMYLKTVESLEKAGFMQYEISNFSIPGYESRHNLKYWNCEEYLGIGPAAHSFTKGKRFYYSPDINEFMGGAKPVDDGTGGDIEEYIMLGLRLTKGIDLKSLLSRYDYNVSKAFTDYCTLLECKGLMKCNGDIISLTPSGFLISNSIICELTERL